jgi:hypothetical protein
MDSSLVNPRELLTSTPIDELFSMHKSLISSEGLLHVWKSSIGIIFLYSLAPNILFPARTRVSSHAAEHGHCLIDLLAHTMASSTERNQTTQIQDCAGGGPNSSSNILTVSLSLCKPVQNDSYRATQRARSPLTSCRSSMQISHRRSIANFPY